MNAGRNDPCPCGSGKKYKKCCLAKDRKGLSENRIEPPPRDWDDAEPEAADAADTLQRADELLRAELSAATSGREDQQPDEPPPQPDPLAQAQDALWEEFEACDYEGQTALFLKTFDTPELISQGMAVEMLDVILRGAKQHDDWGGFEILIRAFQERLPDVFAESAACYVSWLIDGRVARGRFDEIAPLAREIAACAGRDIDIFNLTLDALAYHCDLSTLVEMMRIGWPGVRESADILPWGVDEFAYRACRYEMLSYCVQAASPRPDDPGLIERLEFYEESVNQDFVAAFIESVAGLVHQEPIPGKASAAWCSRVCLEFLGHLIREERMSPGKAELGSGNLSRYLVQRVDGQLEHSPPLYDPGKRPQKRKGKARRTQRRPVHILCPDAKTFEPFLADHMHFLSARYHTVAATMEVIPTWLRFLELRQMVDSQEHLSTLRGLACLHADLLKLWKKYSDDPSLHEAAVQAWQVPQRSPRETQAP